MAYVFPPQPQPAVPVLGCDELFPVRRIFCVGQNYAAHAREMGGDPARQPPCFFTKPTDSIVAGGGAVPYPPGTANLHHEIELVIALGRGGSNLESNQALDYIFGYAAGLDLTRRDLQSTAKAAGQPWDMAKGFDNSAPLSAISPAAGTIHPVKGGIWLTVNGKLRQNGDIADMIWTIPEIIAHLSRLVTLAAGDLIFTGTPSGVGAVVIGDRIEGVIDGVGTISVTIV
ncbi:MAG: fumarylacetoacetate hydrolase family protein [Rhodospirillaceae bacterium]